MRIVVVMDPVATVQVDEDTSFALMIEAQARGHRVDHCLASDVRLESRRVFARVRQAHMQRDPARPVLLDAPEDLCLEDADAVLIRKDPPFDDDYLFLTLILEHVRDATLVLNDPRGLREANEKLYACWFPEVTPETLVSAHKPTIRAFVERIGGRAVIKPLEGHGGSGVFALATDDPNLNALIETVTLEGRRSAMVQAYVPEVTLGDKRILLVDGEPIGAILRLPVGGDLRSNIHVGGRVVHAEVDDADRRIIAAVAPRLRRDGLRFVGLDVIGGLLTEVNVTSPTGIQQMVRLGGGDPTGRVLSFIEAEAARQRG